MTNHIFMKPNQFPTYSMQSLASSPYDIFNMILLQLNEWLSIIPNLFHSLVAKFDEAFPPETREQWLAASVHYMLVGVGVVLLCLCCCCCWPAIICCITSVVVGVWSLISGFFMLLWGMCVRIFRCFCCCGSRTMKMMKAPGRGGRVIIPRISFESNPAAYFTSLRAGSGRLV